LAAGNLDRGGEDLREILLPAAIGESCRRGGVAFQRGVADHGERIAIDQAGRGTAPVLAGDGEVVARDTCDEHDLGFLIHLDLVADPEAIAIGDREGGFGGGIGDRGVVDHVGVGQQRILDPFVNGAGGAALGIAQVIEQWRFEGTDD
jgi:hypothetical protein